MIEALNIHINIHCRYRYFGKGSNPYSVSFINIYPQADIDEKLLEHC